MGEIADMMLDGTLCECCGCYIDDEGADGIPRYCSKQCAGDRGFDDYETTGDRSVNAPNPKKTNCPTCGKRVKKVGLEQHIRDAHPVLGS